MSTEEEEKQNTYIHPFDRLMFGDHERSSEKSPMIRKDDTHQETVDFNELMNQMDILMSSFGHFKPLWKKVTPFLEKWIKK
mgnify:CR=1 FL=1|jgi:phosphomevalonate kinase